MQYSLLAVLFISLALVACDSDSTGERDAPQHVSFEEGREYIYQDSTVYRDSSGAVTYADGDLYSVRVVDTDASLEGAGSGLLQIVTQRMDGGYATNWYRHSDSALVELAYHDPARIPSVAPKNATTISTGVWSPVPTDEQLARTRSAAQDTVIRTNPRLVYAYPFEVSASWVAFREPFRTEHEIVGTEMVTVPAGTFQCVKVRWRISLDPDRLQYDYISNQGLVLRTTEVQRDEPFKGTSTSRLELIERR